MAYRGVSGAPAYLGPRPRGIGDKMAIGVTQRGCGRSLLVGCPAWGRQLQGCWELAAGSSVGSGAATSPAVSSSGGGCENLVAQVAQGVVAAASELAGHRQQRQLAV
jgi:hypothetical protein